MRLLVIFIMFTFLPIINLFAQEQKSDIPFTPGEQISYSVKWNGFAIGDMKLTFWGEEVFDNEESYKITSATDTTQYKGIDTIYVDKETFMPRAVFRELEFMGKTEKIEELYDQEKNILKIKKISNGKEEEQIIEKSDPIQNAVLLYYLTRIEKFDIGQKFEVNLPTKEYNIKVDKLDDVKDAHGNSRSTFLFKSKPKKFKIWIEKQNQNLPIKIACSSFMSIVTMKFKDVEYLNLEK